MKASLVGIVWLAWATACTPLHDKPPAGAGIVPPIVPDGLAADFAFRWPEPASVGVTLRVDTGLGVKVLRAEVELGATDARGHRPLTRSPFEAVDGGGIGAEAMAVSLGITLAPASVVVDRAGNVAGGDGGDPLWVSWVPFWATFKDGAAGASANGGTLRDDHVSQAWPQARHLVYRTTHPARAWAGTTMFGGLREVRLEGDIDARTLQPIRIVNTLDFVERETPIVMTYEFDWSRTNERMRASGAPDAARRPNEDTR